MNISDVAMTEVVDFTQNSFDTYASFLKLKKNYPFNIEDKKKIIEEFRSRSDSFVFDSKSINLKYIVCSEKLEIDPLMDSSVDDYRLFRTKNYLREKISSFSSFSNDKGFFVIGRLVHYHVDSYPNLFFIDDADILVQSEYINKKSIYTLNKKCKNYIGKIVEDESVKKIFNFLRALDNTNSTNTPEWLQNYFLM